MGDTEEWVVDLPVYSIRCDYGHHYHFGTDQEVAEQVERCREEVRQIFGE